MYYTAYNFICPISIDIIFINLTWFIQIIAMIKHITYSDHRMTISAMKCRESAIQHDCDDSSIYGPADLSEDFKDHMKDVLKHERGAGFYCWKPYIVRKEMQSLEDGDILIYTDAGTMFRNSVGHIIRNMDQDLFLFSNGWPHVEWCKMDTLDVILGVRPISKDFKQVQASQIFIRVSSFSRAIIDQWFHYSIDHHGKYINNDPSESRNIEGFQEHRWDQSILGCLQILHNIKLHWFPTTYSNHLPRGPQDSYPAMFDHHRKRNNEW